MPGGKLFDFDWALWFQWIMATAMGWIIGLALLSGLPLLASGFAIAILQWMVLLRRLGQAWRWIVFSFAGWAAGYLITVFLVPAELEIFNGSVLGLAVGVAQWGILRTKVRWAAWWVVFSLIGWTTGLTLLPGLFSTGAVAGALTGIALIVLLRFPKDILSKEQIPS
jgi:hypothetical protein